MGMKQGKWTCMVLYGKPDRRFKRYFIRQLINKIKEIRGPLIYIGDWNCIWNKNDKIGGQFIPN